MRIARMLAKIAATRVPRIETALPSRDHKAARLQTAAFPSKIFIRVAKNCDLRLCLQSSTVELPNLMDDLD